MGRAGKLDFSLDRVRAVDGEWIPLRYTVNNGGSKKTGSRQSPVTTLIVLVASTILPVDSMAHYPVAVHFRSMNFGSNTGGVKRQEISGPPILERHGMLFSGGTLCIVHRIKRAYCHCAADVIGVIDAIPRNPA
jgi:hypothetical protein